MQVLKTKFFQAVFLALVAVATLFPPFNWGEERLGTERERKLLQRDNPGLYQAIPIKEYSFLFADSEEVFFNESLHRRVILPELMLEYLLAFIVAVSIGSFRKQ